jgi:alpha-beta hydrolase superfamily lysophospholipase
LASNYVGCLLSLVLCLVIFAALIHFLQFRFIYLPHRYSIGNLIQVAEQQTLTLWPTSDEGYRGLATPASTGARGTVVVYHGNAGSALNRLHYVAALERLGFHVVLAEYPGYGAREGQLNEQALVADAKTTVQWAARDFGGPVYVWGESLGCGVATAVAADPSLPVAGLALITPFTTLPDLAQAIYWYLPIRWLVRDQYDNVANLASFQKPVALLVAEQDEIMPRAQAEALYAGLTTQKKMWVLQDARHNTWPTMAEEPWWREVADFLDSN